MPEVCSEGNSRITVAEIRRRLKLGRKKIYHMLEDGVIPAVRCGKLWVITRHSYLAWEATAGQTRAA